MNRDGWTKFEGLVYGTVFTPEFIKSVIIENYDLDKEIIVELFAQGVNLLYLVSLKERKYVFRLSQGKEKLLISEDKFSFEEQLNFEMNALLHLERHNLGVNIPLLTKSHKNYGSLIAPEGERYFVLLTFMEGNPLLLSDLDETQAKDIGILIAKVHQTLDSLNTSERRLSYEDILSEKVFDRIITNFKLAYPELIDKMKNIYSKFKLTLETLPLPETSIGVNHGDTNFRNFLFAGDKINLIDFDFMFVGCKSLDLALITILSEIGFKQEEIKQKEMKNVEIIFEGYNSIREIPLIETRNKDLFVIMRLLGLFNFLTLNFFGTFTEPNPFIKSILDYFFKTSEKLWSQNE